jgi:hypothetical protein
MDRTRPGQRDGDGREQVALVAAQAGQPGEEGQHPDDGPDPDPDAPAAALADGQREPGGQGRRQAERGGVRARHQRHLAREVALDQRRHQHVADGDARAEGDRAGPQREGLARQRPDDGGDEHHRGGGEDRPVRAPAPAQQLHEGRHPGEGEQRHRAEQPERRRAQAGVGGDEPEHRAEGGERGA